MIFIYCQPFFSPLLSCSTVHLFYFSEPSALKNTPKGSRTPVAGLRTRRPGPLDDGGVRKSKFKNKKSKIKLAAVGIEPTTLGL